MKELNIHCGCGWKEHQFYIWYDPDEEPCHRLLVFDVHLSTWKGFFRRLWVGLRYAFGYRSRYGDWDEVLIGTDSAREIVGFIEGFLGTDAI